MSEKHDEPQTQAPSAGTPEGEADIPVEVDEAEPAAPADPLAALEQRVAELEKDKQQIYDRLVRTAADLDNFRKRSRRELDDARVDERFKVLREMLPVIDNLERAIEHADKSDEAGGVLQGVQLVLRQFGQALERCDVVAFDATGQAFDPNLHEAISQVETDDVPAGTVVKMLQKGYRAGAGRLLRPALVVVARPRPVDEAGGASEGNGADPAGGNGADSTGGAGERDDAVGDGGGG